MEATGGTGTANDARVVMTTSPEGTSEPSEEAVRRWQRAEADLVVAAAQTKIARLQEHLAAAEAALAQAVAEREALN